ncbi:hypothetical protein M432DRAFT_642631 [Thermoascus aurantiacus ATCC 26904]
MASEAKDTSQKTAWERVEKRFNGKNASEYFDPCQDFADRSIRCLRRNAGDKEFCHDYFQ